MKTLALVWFILCAVFGYVLGGWVAGLEMAAYSLIPIAWIGLARSTFP